MGKLFLTGPEATSAARHLFSRDVSGKGRRNPCTYTLMLNRQGGIESDLIVTKLNDKSGGWWDAVVRVGAFSVCITLRVSMGQFNYSAIGIATKLRSCFLRSPHSGALWQSVYCASDEAFIWYSQQLFIFKPRNHQLDSALRDPRVKEVYDMLFEFTRQDTLTYKVIFVIFQTPSTIWLLVESPPSTARATSATSSPISGSNARWRTGRKRWLSWACKARRGENFITLQ